MQGAPFFLLEVMKPSLSPPLRMTWARYKKVYRFDATLI